MTGTFSKYKLFKTDRYETLRSFNKTGSFGKSK